MDISLDTNILFEDPWLRSVQLKALLDHLQVSQSSLILSEVVCIELDALYSRRIDEVFVSHKKVASTAQRFNLEGFADSLNDERIKANIEAWRTNIQRLYRAWYVEVLPISGSVAREAVVRAANRLPPCKADGRGERDAMIWLSLLERCETSRLVNPNYELGLISRNDRDFANSQGKLRQELVQDTADRNVSIRLFASVQDFVTQCLESVSYITLEWILERIDEETIRAFTLNTIDKDYLFRYHFKICDYEKREAFSLVGVDDIYQLNIVEFVGVFAWSFDDGRTEGVITFNVYIEADGLCEPNEDYKEYLRETAYGHNDTGYYGGYSRVTGRGLQRNYPLQTNLISQSCASFAEVQIQLSFRLSSNEVQIIDIQNIDSF